jgi:3-deoxy-D-arabino-heptulosonate 7-phosphate (DAHP) synthase
MIDKEKQFVGGDKFPNYSRAEIEESYHKEFTDEQWEMIVDYAHNADDEDEYDEKMKMKKKKKKDSETEDNIEESTKSPFMSN